MLQDRPYLIATVALALLVLFFHLLTPWGMEDDYWETAAAIREAGRSPFHPQNPLIALGEGTSPRYVPYTIFWGMVENATRLPNSWVMILAGLGNTLLLFWGIHRFISRQFRRDGLPLYVLGAMLLIWGAGYSQANAYQLEILVWAAPYVGIAAFANCFHAVAALRDYLNTAHIRHVVIYALLAVIAFLTHPITAVFLFAAVVAILWDERRWMQLLLLQGVPLLCLAAALVWPYFDYWTVLTKGSSEAWFVSPMFSNRPAALGMAIAGIPILFYLARQKQARFLAYGFVICSGGYLLSERLGILIGGRLLFFAMVFVHIGMALFALERRLISWREWKTSLAGTGLHFVLAATVLLPSLAYRAGKLAFYAKQSVSADQSKPNFLRQPDPFYFLADHLDEHSIVMTDVRSGWVVPALSGARIVTQAKGNPLLQEEIIRRQRDARSFFQDSLSTDTRRRMLADYRATHLLVSRIDPDSLHESLFSQLDSLGTRQATSGLVELLRVKG